MNLNADHRKALDLSLIYHKATPTLGSLLRQRLPALALRSGITATSAYIAFRSQGWTFGAACFTAGAYLGSLLSTFTQLASLAKLWPIVDRIVEWQKVDALLDQKKSG